MTKNNPPEKTPDRLRGYLRAFAEKYPNAWKQFELFRAARGKELPDWPDWCWCPLSASYAIVSGGGDNRVPLERVADVGALATLAAWRMTQGIYRFDSDVFAALWDTPLAKIPVEILYRLPEWCVYVEAPAEGYQVDGLDISGFFVHLEHDVETDRPELRFAFDFGERLLPFPIHLTAETLAECVAAALRESERQAARGGLDFSVSVETVGSAVSSMASVVSVVLYLCSVSADIADLRGKRDRPANPKPRKTKRGLRTFPPDVGATTWLVGHRIGASLRLAAGGGEGRAGAGAGGAMERSSPRPHIRRAHWHTYLTGPRDRPQKPVLKWLPPTPVGAGEIVPTIREVE